MNPIAVIPAHSHIDWRLNQVLMTLRIPIMHVHGSSDLVRARSVLLSDALRSNHTPLLLIDSDMVPTVEQVEMLVESPKLSEDCAVTGAYHTRTHTFAFNPCDHTRAFNLQGSPRFVECWGAGLGFSAITRESLGRFAEKLPLLRDSRNEWWPFCLPQLVTDERYTGGKLVYCSEDYSFWWRLRQLGGVKLWLDTHLAIGHLVTAPLIPKEGSLVDPRLRSNAS